MKRVLFVCAILFGWDASAFDQATLCGPHAGYRPIAERMKPGLLFSVERCKVPPSHVFGTYHSDDPALLDVEPDLRRTLNGARIALFEIENSPEVLKQTVRRLLLPEGKSLSGIVGQPLFDRFAAIMADRMPGRDASVYEELKPWAAALLLEYPPPVADGEVLDDRIQKLARARGLRVRGLETASEQIGFFDKLTVAEQTYLLSDGVEHFDENEKLNAKLDRLYRARDLTAVGLLSKEAFADIDDRALAKKIERFLLTERNARMHVRMLPEVRKGGALIAIGALHLIGPDGLLAALEKDGYLIDQPGSGSTDGPR